MPDSFINVLKRSDNVALLLLVLTVFLLFSFVGLLIMSAQVRRMNRRIDRLTSGTNGSNLEETLAAHLAAVAQAVRRMETLEQTVGVLQAKIPLCLQKTGLIRYDAFDDVGGAQSFSLALLDANGDGVVVTGVYGRNDSRVYSKSVQNGRASHALSQEEEQALRQAGG